MPRIYKHKTTRRNASHKAQQLPCKFQAGFLSSLDKRTDLAKALRTNYDAVIADVGGIVDVNGTARGFGDVMEQWQSKDFAAIDPGLMRCNGRSSADAKSRVYLERGRGHSKTTDLAVTCCWALAFATRPLRCYALAADK